MPTALTDNFIAQSFNILLIGDEFHLILLIELVLIISNPIGEIETNATVSKPLDRPLNLRGLNTLAKLVKPERQTPKGVYVIESSFA